MPNMIHITRSREQGEAGLAISLEEWIAVVDQHAHTRLAAGNYAVTLPETGQVFILPNNGGDAEVNFADTGWRRVFRWDEEGVIFRATDDFADAGCRLREVARALAGALGAIVRGADGEIYP